MRLSLGISTCPNDTFIYEALIRGLDKSPFEWDVHFADVQTLNEMVVRGELDVAKVSAQVYPKVRENYRWLHCGGAIGYGCGPLLLSSGTSRFDPALETVLPGEQTTAALLFRFWYAHKFGNKSGYASSPRVRYALFNEVYSSLLDKSAVQGVTIHEHRFTWKRDGLHMLQDLGAYWETQTGSPIPLGISVARRSLSDEVVKNVENEIRGSLADAWNRDALVTPFIREKAQISDEKVMEAHIKMFVNDFSESVGDTGERALMCLWNVAEC